MLIKVKDLYSFDIDDKDNDNDNDKDVMNTWDVMSKWKISWASDETPTVAAESPWGPSDSDSWGVGLQHFPERNLRALPIAYTLPEMRPKRICSKREQVRLKRV